jgi:hypothetical protein
MSLSVGRAKLLSAMKDLKLRWEKAKLNWDDPISQDVERTIVQAMEPRVRAAVSAMERVGEVVARARRDCG